MKKLILFGLTVALLAFTGCNKDDGPKGSSLKLKIDGEVIDLEDANFYLSFSGNYDGVNDETDVDTHTYGDLFITDEDWDLDEQYTYEIYMYVDYPLDEKPDGDFYILDYEEWEETWVDFTATTRVVWIEIIYNYNSSNDTYYWVGFDATSPSSNDSFVVSEDNDDNVRIKFKSEAMDSWMRGTDGWVDQETTLEVSLDFEGAIIDLSDRRVRTDKKPLRQSKRNMN